MMDDELERLWSMVNVLERNVAAVRTAVANLRAQPQREEQPRTHEPKVTPTSIAPSDAQAKVPEVSVQAEPPAQQVPKPKLDLENLIGEKWFLYVGALLLVIGVASFLKIAFDRDWIGPAMRVAMGIIGGAFVIGITTSLRRRVAPFFADALVGVGAAIEYLSFFSAGALFHVMQLSEIMAGMILVTAAVGVLAYRGARQSLAYVSLAGGLLTPLLVGSTSPDALLLFVYLAVLSAFAVALGELRRWIGVPFASLCGTIIYWIAFGYANAGQHPIFERVAIALVLYAIFASTAIIAWRRKEDLDPARLTIVILNAVWFLAGISTLAADSRAVLAAALLLVTLGHVVCARITQQRHQLWLATVSLAFAIPPLAYSFTSVDPEVVVRTAMHVGWIALACGAAIVGIRRPDRVLAVLGLLIYATCALHLLVLAQAADVGTLFLNDRFISLAALAASLVLVMRAWSKAPLELTPPLRTTLAIIIDATLLLAISPEAWHIGQLLAPGTQGQAGAAGISVAWALFGAALVIAGIREKDAVQRWAGLILLGGTALKVFLYDLVGLDIVFRVFSAIVLGLVFVVIAYLYQRRVSGEKASSQE